MSKRPTKTIQNLLSDFSKVLALDLCFHDRLDLSKLPVSWRKHTCQPCDSFKAKASHHRRCIEFDAQNVHDLLAINPGARIIRCPAGYSQIVAGVLCNGLFVGVVFVGPFWLGRSKPPHEKLIRIKKQTALAPHLTVVDALATELGKHLRDASVKPADRRQIILRFIQSRHAEKITLNDLADHMNLSPSRMGHVVNETCGMTFPELLAQTRLQEAARLLTASDWPIGEIAGRIGYDDPNYFSRSFTNQYTLSPREYRKKFFTGI